MYEQYLTVSCGRGCPSPPVTRHQIYHPRQPPQPDERGSLWQPKAHTDAGDQPRVHRSVPDCATTGSEIRRPGGCVNTELIAGSCLRRPPWWWWLGSENVSVSTAFTALVSSFTADATRAEMSQVVDAALAPSDAPAWAWGRRHGREGIKRPRNAKRLVLCGAKVSNCARSGGSLNFENSGNAALRDPRKPANARIATSIQQANSDGATPRFSPGPALLCSCLKSKVTSESCTYH